MTEVRFGSAPFDLLPFVRLAVEELGYFRPECANELAGLFEQLWPSGVSATMLIYNDLEDMTDEEKIAAGLTKRRLPRALWLSLSAKGRVDPHHSATVLARRIIFCVQRNRFDRDEPSWSTFCTRVRFAARAKPEHLCARSQELAGLVLIREERFPLPLPGCDKEWCPCRWDYLPDE